MKKITILIISILLSNAGFSQVKDISFTLSPIADYTWRDKQSGLEDGTSIGGKVGFALGEYIELRAVFLHSLDLKTSFNRYGIDGYNSSLFNQQKINLTRWGGELKINFASGTFSPFLSLGTGVQNIEIDQGDNFDQIYISSGLGIKTKINDRIVFTLEGKNSLYNFNAGKYLLTEQNKNDFGVTDADFSSHLLSNWTAQASLQFYLGGRKPGTLSALDKAYLQKFKGGFKGIQWIVEPSINYIEFDDNSQFRNSWLLGGYAGLDFNKYTGIRGFFFRATNDEQVSTSFDKLAMYGLEFRARLNDGNGVTPYIILGGGYLNTLNNYKGKDGFSIDSKEFASAGLGLNIPISRNILITGGARALITSGLNIEDLTGPDELQTHIMYNAGIKLVFGKKSTDPDEIYESQLNTELETQRKLSQEEMEAKLQEQRVSNEKKLKRLEKEYKTKLDSLEAEIESANEANDVNKAVDLLEKKKEARKALDEVEKVSKKSTEMGGKTSQEIKETKTEPVVKEKTAPVTQPKELIRMTPAELELLIDKILDKTESKDLNNRFQQIKNNEVELLKKRIEFLEKKLVEPKNTPSATKKTTK